MSFFRIFSKNGVWNGFLFGFYKIRGVQNFSAKSLRRRIYYVMAHGDHTWDSPLWGSLKNKILVHFRRTVIWLVRNSFSTQPSLVIWKMSFGQVRSHLFENALKFCFWDCTKILVCHVTGVSERKWWKIRWLENALKF